MTKADVLKLPILITCSPVDRIRAHNVARTAFGNRDKTQVIIVPDDNTHDLTGYNHRTLEEVQAALHETRHSRAQPVD